MRTFTRPPPPIYQTPFQQIYTGVFPAPVTRWQKWTYFSGIDEWRVRKVVTELWKNVHAPKRTKEPPFGANWSEVNAYLDLRTYEVCLCYHQLERDLKMEALPWVERLAYRIAYYLFSCIFKKPETPTFPPLESQILVWDEKLTTFPTNSLNQPTVQGQLGAQLTVDPDTQLTSELTLFWEEGDEIKASFQVGRIWENHEGVELGESQLQLGLQDRISQKFSATKIKAGFLIDTIHEISDKTFALLVKAMVQEMRASKWDSLRIKKENMPSLYLSILNQLGFEEINDEYRLELSKLPHTQIAWINDDFSRDIKTWDVVAEPKASFFPAHFHVDPSHFIAIKSAL